MDILPPTISVNKNVDKDEKNYYCLIVAKGGRYNFIEGVWIPDQVGNDKQHNRGGCATLQEDNSSTPSLVQEWGNGLCFGGLRCPAG